MTDQPPDFDLAQRTGPAGPRGKESSIDPVRRRAALIATVVTVPFMVIVVLVLVLLTRSGEPGATHPSGASALPAISVSAPPHSVAQQASCAKWLAEQPVSLGKLTPRVVHTVPDSSFVVAWGDPPVIFSCGVDRPAELQPGTSATLRPDGSAHPIFFLVEPHGGGSTWYVIDRGPYLSIQFPAGVQPADYLQALAKTVTTSLPAVCSTDSTIADPDKLCTRRR